MAQKVVLLTYVITTNRTKEHAWTQKDSAIYQHFKECSGWNHITGLLCMDSEPVDVRQLQINTVQNNIKVIGRSDNWQTLAFLETLAIKDRNPSLNSGIKAAKELSLF